MTDTTDNTPAVSPPELPQTSDPSSNTTEQPTSYSSVSGASQSVTQQRYNPISSDQKPTITDTSSAPNQDTVNINTTTPNEEEKTSPATDNTAPTVNTVSSQPTVTVQPTATTTTQPQAIQSPTTAQTANAANAANAAAQQQQQQLLAAQMAQAQMAANPMLAANMAMLQQQSNMAQKAQDPSKRLNKYSCWPPPEQQQYLSFHPLGWPIDPDYQYQISNYLGPSMGAAAQSMAAQNMAMNPLLAQAGGGLGGGLNPLLAAQAAAQNPLSLLAAQAAFNPLLAGTTPGIGGGIGGLGAPTSTIGGMGSTSIGASTTGITGGGAGISGGTISGKQWSLFVFHLPEDIDDHGLLQLFAPYGAMRSNVMRHDTGRSRGFGFVHFNTRHEAQIAIDMMNGHQIGRKRLRVSFKREEPHDKMRGGGPGNNNNQNGGGAPNNNNPAGMNQAGDDKK